LNSFLNAQLDSEKMAYKVNFLDCFFFAFFASMPSAVLACRRRDGRSLLLTTIWTDYIATDSRLEGGVNRAKLKFTNINTTTSRVSVRNINESEREGAKQIPSE
jgi:hypothetical protein